MKRSNSKRKVRIVSTLIRELSSTHPNTAKFLTRAQSNREKRLSEYIGGVRLKGFKELIDHLEKLEIVYRKNRKLRRISFLLDRARGDFQVALEATLSGFHSVAYDSMRDVMEIEFLLREFYFEPGHIEQWLTCSNKERNDKFRPAILRQRHAARIGRKPHDLGEAHDYRGHSMFIHVTPYQNPFGGPGLTDKEDLFNHDSCFWEIFEHARRLFFVAHNLRRKVAPHLKAPWGPVRGLKDVREAWIRTQEWQSVFMAIIKVVSEEQDLDREIK